MSINERQAYMMILLTVVTSVIYFLLLGIIRKVSSGNAPQKLRWNFIFRKISGFVIYGLIPFILVIITDSWGSIRGIMSVGDFSGIWLLLLAVCTIIIVLNAYIARNPTVQKVYPELRLSSWSPGDLLLESTSWIIYLGGYEFLFRGLLLFTCIQAFGTWPAVAVNLVLYAALHYPKGWKEMLGAIPFGLVLCYVTHKSGSVLPAIIIHSVQAISCEMFAIFYSPDMKFDIIKVSKS